VLSVPESVGLLRRSGEPCPVRARGGHGSRRLGQCGFYGERKEHRVVRSVGSIEELTGLLADERKVYLRYSAGPGADSSQSSRDYESGLELPGLAALDLTAPSWWTRPLADWLARQICKYGHLAEHESGRYAWLLVGREAGRGPDNEPLIADAVPVGRLADGLLAEARERYRTRFEVGRES
jgi:hypothetical protein